MNQVIKILKQDGLKAAWYYLKGNIRWRLHKNAIADWEAKKQLCPNCLTANSCQGHLIDGVPCGCEYGPVALSGRDCKQPVVNNGSTNSKTGAKSGRRKSQKHDAAKSKA